MADHKIKCYLILWSAQNFYFCNLYSFAMPSLFMFAIASSIFFLSIKYHKDTCLLRQILQKNKQLQPFKLYITAFYIKPIHAVQCVFIHVKTNHAHQRSSTPSTSRDRCPILRQWSVKWNGSNVRQCGNVFASNSRLCRINLWSNPAVGIDSYINSRSLQAIKPWPCYYRLLH